MKKSNIAIFVPHLGCKNDCSFCNQRVITGRQAQPAPDDVRRSVETALAYGGVYEIAFFGGSFTAVDRHYMTALLEAAAPYVDGKTVTGIRISTRPDAVDEEVLSVLKSYHVTSVELGAQSMYDRVLRLNGRGHSAQAVRDAACRVRKAGFSLGLQMMTGLYGDTDAGAIYTAKEFIALHPDTVRIYPTVVLPHTKLAALYENGQYVPQTLEEAVALCARLYAMFTKNGIRVIRMGLHAEQSMQQAKLAGAYHPAFGELVASRVLRDRILAYPPGHYRVYICPGSVSKLVGQKKENIRALEALGYHLQIVRDRALQDCDLRLEHVTENA